jgi:hypothetical protein
MIHHLPDSANLAAIESPQSALKHKQTRGTLPDDAELHFVGLTPPITVNIRTACRISDLGRSTICVAISNREIETIKVGTRRLLIYESLRRWLLAKRIPVEAPPATPTHTHDAAGALIACHTLPARGKGPHPKRRKLETTKPPAP